MLFEQPFIKLRCRIGLNPTVMANARILVVLRIPTRGLECSNHVLRALDLDRGVCGAVKTPARDVLDLLGLRRVAATADGNNGSPALWIFGRQAPRAETAHGEAGQINPLGIDLVTFLHVNCLRWAYPG